MPEKVAPFQAQAVPCPKRYGVNGATFERSHSGAFSTYIDLTHWCERPLRIENNSILNVPTEQKKPKISAIVISRKKHFAIMEFKVMLELYEGWEFDLRPWSCKILDTG